MTSTNMNMNMNKAIIDDLKDYYIAESEVSNVNPNDYKFAYDNEHPWLTPPDNKNTDTTTTNNASNDASINANNNTSITDNENQNKKTALLALKQCIQSNNGYDNLMNALRVNALKAITPGECMLSLRALQALQLINMIDREITIVDMPTLLLNDDNITNAMTDYTIPINTIISMITTEYDKLQSDDFIRDAYEQIDNIINVNRDWIINNHLLTKNTAALLTNTNTDNDTTATDNDTTADNTANTIAGTDTADTIDNNDATGTVSDTETDSHDSTVSTVNSTADNASTMSTNADNTTNADTADDASIFDTFIKGHGIPWGLITPDKNHVLTYYLSGMNNLPLELELIEDMLTLESSKSESKTTNTDDTGSTVSTSTDNERSSVYFTPNRAITPERLECIIGVSGDDYINKHDFTAFIELMALPPSILKIGMNGVLALTANRFDDYNNIDMSELTTRGLDVYNLIASEMQLIPND